MAATRIRGAAIRFLPKMRFYSFSRWGMNRLNTVPWCWADVLLFTLIRPSCFWMIPMLTHSPRPVPVMPLVEKNGSKMRASVSFDMP